MLAVQTQKADLINLLIAAKANVNVKENKDGDTALILALRLRNIGLVQALISAGADVNCTNDAKKSVMSSAVDTGSTELIECILDTCPQNMGSAVFSATLQGEMGIVQMLLDAGADMDHPSHAHEGLTALKLAIIKKNAELAEFLLREGANVNGSPPCYPCAKK